MDKDMTERGMMLGEAAMRRGLYGFTGNGACLYPFSWLRLGFARRWAVYPNRYRKRIMPVE